MRRRSLQDDALRPAAWRPGPVILALLALAAPAPGGAAAADGRAVMARVQAQDGATDEVVELRMTLVDQGGSARRRRATTYRKSVGAPGPGTPYKRLIVFHEPPELAKSGVLTIEHRDREDDQWAYLPAYHTTRRIVPANRSNTYMGTDFTYEDITTQKLDAYRWDALPDEPVEGTRCHVVDAVPAVDTLRAESGYSRTRYWVDAERFVVLRAEYFDRSGRLLKRHVGSRVVRVGDAFRVGHVEVTNVQRDHRTLVDYENWAIGTGLDDDVFTLRFLQRGR